jgi:hypothetical protein
MPHPVAVAVELTDQERAAWRRDRAGVRALQALAMRSWIVLLAADGLNLDPPIRLVVGRRAGRGRCGRG